MITGTPATGVENDNRFYFFEIW